MTNEADLLRTSLNAWHRANGGQMIDFGGWEMPVQYETGIILEHLAVRRVGGLFDVSHMGRFRIKGKNKTGFLQHVLTNNAEALEPWQAQYTLVPNEQGGAIDDAYLYRFGEDDLLLVVNASNREKVWSHFQAQLTHFEDVQIEDDTEKVGMIAFQGPLTKRILKGAIEDGTLPEPMRNRLSEVTIAGTKVLIGDVDGVGAGYPLSHEKLSPVLAFYVVNGWEDACALATKLLELGGLGHTMAMHSRDEKIIMEFALRKPAMRVLVNTASSLGGVGGTTGLFPALTLGCGTYGGNIISENLSPLHLINRKRLAYGQRDIEELKQDLLKGTSFGGAAASAPEARKRTAAKEESPALPSEEELVRTIVAEVFRELTKTNRA